MKTTNAEERVKRDRIMDKFCESRNLWYDSVNEFDQVDAKLYNKRTDGKLLGLVKVKSTPSNFGTQPAVPVDKQLVDFLFELAKFAGTKAVIIVKFRDKVKYARLEDPEKLLTTTVKRGKTESIHTLFPIGQFADL